MQDNAPTHDVVTARTRDASASATRRAPALLGGMPAVRAVRRVAVLKPKFVAGRPGRGPRRAWTCLPRGDRRTMRTFGIQQSIVDL